MTYELGSAHYEYIQATGASLRENDAMTISGENDNFVTNNWAYAGLGRKDYRSLVSSQ